MKINCGKSSNGSGEDLSENMKHPEDEASPKVAETHRKCDCPHHLNDERYKHKIKVIYLLLVTLFVCIFLQSYLLLTYVNRKIISEHKENVVAIDISGKMIGESGEVEGSGVSENTKHKSERIRRSEIEYYVKSYLQESLKPKDNFVQLMKHVEYRSSELPYLNEQTVQNERKLSNHEFGSRAKREIHFNDKLVSGQSSQEGTPYAEFFNPKQRAELERKDAEIIRKTGHKGAAPGGDEWVWLTSYSRIPFDAISGFCRATKEYCPPGPPGLPGVPGPKGNRGDTGIPGPPGMDGREGKTGPRGPKGEIGYPGNPGLDGRDGVPGEPGLDGVPGRAGADGIPGKDGKNGREGIDGINGKDGRDGLQGPPGPVGPPGEKGDEGMPGPQGKSGVPGRDGKHGQPGINTWQVGNASVLLIPPKITGGGTLEALRPIVVAEGQHLRLRCAAEGKPQPNVEWRREDGKPVTVGAWQAATLAGHTLNITKINRVHMGAYSCLANNGVPPAANQTFNIEVHFAPMIRVRQQMVYASNGTKAQFECEVEAFPEAIKYWVRVPDGRLIENLTNKYSIETKEDGYKSRMFLNVSRIRARDYGEYNCVAKNELGVTKAAFHLQEKHPHYYRPLPDSTAVQVFGTKPPDQESYEDICGPPTTCPECPDPRNFKCKDAVVSLYDLVGNLEIKPTVSNANYTGLSNRTPDCVLYAVGKPVFHKFTDSNYGAWLKDPLPPNDAAMEKVWTTNENDTKILYEHKTKLAYRQNNVLKKYALGVPFRGNSHVVFNGSFFYNERDKPKIIKYDLHLEKETASRELEGATTNGSNYLYTTEHNYMDLNVDSNGLWVIYSTPDSNHTIVAKLDANDLKIQYSWNISVNHHKVGEMFIVCGVLYAIDSVTERTTKIRLALDLYHSKLLDVNLSFTNPFRKTTSVGYNPKNKELYTWDKGNQLTYPIRYHEIGYNSTATDKNEEAHPQMQTGYDITDGNDGN